MRQKSSSEKGLAAVRVSWLSAALITAAAAVWLIGVFELDTLLRVELNCDDQRHYGNARLGELVSCAVKGGPSGWVYLVWAVGPLFYIGLRQIVSKSLNRNGSKK